jgi:hypothetical protein
LHVDNGRFPKFTIGLNRLQTDCIVQTV